MNGIKNQIRNSEIGSYVGGDLHIDNINLVIRPEDAGSREICAAGKDSAFHDRKQYFMDKWNACLFLHQWNCDRKLTLRQAFLFPEYEMMGQQYDDLERRLEDFRESSQRSMLLLGMPGMGKTSLTAWLAEHYRDDDSMLFLRFRDLNRDFPDGTDLLAAVCAEMGCRSSELSGKKLVLDGFDEWRYTGDRQRLLKDFMLDIMNLDNFQVLLTSRYNYIDLHDTEVEQVVKLLPFSRKKIAAFYQLFFGMDLQADMEIRNTEVLGIPVILYMALSTGVDITVAVDRCRIYEKIFALEGGIFDRFKTRGQKAYEDGSHPVQYAKRELKIVLQKLAFAIFQGNGESISNKKYQELVQEVMGRNEQISYDFPVKNLLEDSGSIEFVHKSIYEYFVAEYISEKIQDGLQGGNEEAMAGIFGDLLGFAEVSDEIYAFLEHLVCQPQREYSWRFIYSVFLLMLKRGMTSFSGVKSETNVIVREKRIFCNMLRIIHIGHEGKIPIKKALERELVCYINLSDWFTCLDLSYFGLNDLCLGRVNLRRADLTGADLKGADLGRADLGGAKLQKACLTEADLREANLSGADLRRADLSGADLSGADLRCAGLEGADFIEADFIGADLSSADLRCADLSGADLRCADLSNADLDGADLDGADFGGAELGE